MKLTIILSQLTAIAVVSASAVCLVNDCILCIAAGEVVPLGKSTCNGIEYDDEQTALNDCWVGSAREALPGESGRTGTIDNTPACSVSFSLTKVLLDENGDCTRTEIPLPPGFDVLNRDCTGFIPNPNSQSCNEPS